MKFASKAAVALVGAFAFAGSAQAQLKAAVSSDQLKPPASILLDCAKAAPKGAVTNLPADLATWATVYCTKNGQIFNANDKYFGAFPDSGARATFGAAEMDNKTGADREKAYFKAVTYNPMADGDYQALLKADPISEKILKGKKLYRLDLVSSGDNVLSFLVVEPLAEPFWVFPLTEKGLGSPAFFVVSVASINRSR
ncbi:MAG: hypothetical protein KDJ25_01340 [Rhodoblastus sp.]|nr:hypothetical protein [Rhodoblastus sp.]